MKSKLKQLLKKTITPHHFEKWYHDILVAVPRILGGLMLSLEFGSSKFGMPWSTTDEMGLFQVAEWFPDDMMKFGVPFTLAPSFFAWMGAFVEAVGGLFWVFGLGTRFWSALMAITMLVAIFFQKWPDAMEYGSSWPLLPAIGFLWIAFYTLVTGSGKIGIDYLLTKNKK